MAKRGLGRGFDSLIPSELLDESFDPTADQDGRVSDLRQIKLSEITADPNQPRRYFDEVALEELAISIKEHGVVQPIVVTPRKEGGYVIVAGERRYRAAIQAGLEKIPALVRTLSAQHKLELSLIENLQRRDLNVLETATAYLKLRDQFNLTLDEIGQRVGGKSVSAISNTLRLLRLPESVRQALADGKLREGQARPLIGLEEEEVEKILPKILREEWSARAIEQYIVDLKAQRRHAKSMNPKLATNTAEMYSDQVKALETRFKTPVKIQSNTRGAGQIIIKFKTPADFKRISQLINQESR